jgi:hypothetical protein
MRHLSKFVEDIINSGARAVLFPSRSPAVNGTGFIPFVQRYRKFVTVVLAVHDKSVLP